MFFMNRATHDVVARPEDVSGGPNLRCVTPCGTNRRGAVRPVSEPVMQALRRDAPTGPATARGETVWAELERW